MNASDRALVETAFDDVEEEENECPECGDPDCEGECMDEDYDEDDEEFEDEDED